MEEKAREEEGPGAGEVVGASSERVELHENEKHEGQLAVHLSVQFHAKVIARVALHPQPLAVLPVPPLAQQERVLRLFSAPAPVRSQGSVLLANAYLGMVLDDPKPCGSGTLRSWRRWKARGEGGAW